MKTAVHYRAIIRTTLTGLTLAVVLAGCMTPIWSEGKKLKIQVYRDGVAVVAGHRVSAHTLGPDLKALKVPPYAPLLIQLPARPPDILKNRITKSLRNAGYGKFIFVGDRHVEAKVKR